MNGEPKKEGIRLGPLLSWSGAAVMVAVPLIMAAIALASDEPPDVAFVFTDPLLLPVLSLMAAFTIMTTGLFGTLRDKGDGLGRRLLVRAPLAVLVVVGCVAMRPVVMRGAAPTRQAILLMKKHPVAAKRIGAPVRVGWCVSGSLHASASVNDEEVPPHIDATVPVSGPAGSGELQIVGREVGSRWAFERVALKLDRGGDTIYVTGAAAPRKADPSSPFDGFAIGGGIVALLALIGGSIKLMLRGSDPKRAVASVEVAPGSAFTLRFTPAEPRKHNLFVLFDLEFEGSEDDYGVTAKLEIRVGSGAAQALEHRIGDKAPALGTSFTENNTLYRSMATSGMGPNTQSAAAPIAELPAVRDEVVISGKVVVAEGVTAKRLLVYAVPS